MTTVKISDFADFAGKDLLLAAQTRGIEICGKKLSWRTPATDLMLVGLADILVEHDAALADLAKRLPKPPTI